MITAIPMMSRRRSVFIRLTLIADRGTDKSPPIIR